MKVFLAVFAVLCVVGCSQQTSVKSLGERIECFRSIQPRIYEGRITELVEGLRDQLKEGIPDQGIPALDPFVMKDWNLKVDEEFAKLDWTMNGQIGGLMNWNLTNMKFSIAGLKFSFEVPIPLIEGKGTYKIDGTLSEVLPVYGSGEFDVTANDLNITGSGKIGSRGTGEDQELFLENFQVGASLDKFFFAVTGLMEDEQLSFLLSQMISDSLPDLIRNFQSQIDAVVSAKVTAAADSVLNNMTMQDILDMLKPKPKDYVYWIGEHCGEY